MKYGLVIALFALIAFAATSEAGGLSRHGESQKIVSLLEKILAKFQKGRSDNSAYQKKLQENLDRAEAAYKAASKTYEKEMAQAQSNAENSESEERLIRKILAMLKSDVGEHKNHVAMSCQEVMKDETNKDGYYYVNVAGQAKKVWCSRQDGRTVFSGSCNKASKGNGWGQTCLNQIEFNHAKEYLDPRSNGDIVIKRAGVYRIVGSATMYSVANRHHFGRVLVNGKTKQYSYSNYNDHSRDHVKLYYPLKKGDKIAVTWYINAGAHSERYPASQMDGANRVQVDYIGSFEETPIFSGGCNGHQRGHGWNRNCINRRDWTPSSIQEKYFLVHADGKVTARQSGYYHIQATNMMHCVNNYAHARIHVGGSQRYYLYSYAANWRQLYADFTYWVNAGQTIDVTWYASGGNPYTRHSMSNDNGYNRMQVRYVGGKERSPYLYFGGCSNHGRGAGWKRYCLNQSWRNDLGKHLSISGNGQITVKKSGNYRISSHAIATRKENGNAFSRIRVDDKVVDSATHWGWKAWTELYHDVIIPLNKGQKVVLEYMASNYAYHAWSGHSSVQIMYIDRD